MAIPEKDARNLGVVFASLWFDSNYCFLSGLQTLAVKLFSSPAALASFAVMLCLAPFAASR